MEAVKEVYDFLKKCGAFYLATVEGDQPRVRPFGAICMFEGKIYTQTGKIKNVSKQLVANPKAEICAFDGGTWVRITCKLIEDTRLEAQEAMLDANPAPRDMYSPGDGNTQVLCFTDAEATFSSFTSEPRTVKF